MDDSRTYQEVSSMEKLQLGSTEYESPTLTVLGTVYALTLGCDKSLGDSDGYTFMGQAIVCRST